ncbi:hypothetical protein [Vibrio gallaecicus]|uniref:hypothetical protein n=1 Tax=Vibrio gallaecicus TaxID=552386 RepID=UPI0025B58CAB|nr:hypothetical protein [Vibrio gallaecicus]MDN3616889.1 hypothetical protein [Vibrio gallaecicus]
MTNITFDFSVYGCFVTTQLFGYFSGSNSLLSECRNHIPFILSEVCISCFLLLGGSKLHDSRTLLFLCSEVSHFVLESKPPNKAIKGMHYTLCLWCRVWCAVLVQWVTPYCSVRRK